MNRIERLIEELCPNGVEYKPLGEVGHYVREKIVGTNLTYENFVGVENLLQNKRGKVEATRSAGTIKVTAYRAGDILLGNIRPYLKKIWLADNEGGCSGDVLAIRISDSFTKTLTSEFLFYVLSSDRFFDFNNSHARGGKMPRGNKKKILDYRIPLPPLEIQQEIVKILDTFQALEAELEARKKQYEFYRDQLLTFTERERVRWATLGTVFAMKAGKAIRREEIAPTRTSSQSFPAYGGNGIRGYVREKSHPGNTVLIGRQGALCGNVNWAPEDFYATEHAIVVTPFEEIDARWAYHMLISLELNQFATKSAQPGLSVQRLKSVPIPIPPLEEQQRIVNILDKFDALVNDLTSGLPAEIEARRKQYEHYRDQLLTFKELSA